MELIAHRAGNEVHLVAAAAVVADTIEVDVHLFRNRLEVRHAKIMLWPFPWLWEKWEILPPDSPRPALAEVLAAAPDDVGLWFDLKGFGPRLAWKVLAAADGRAPMTASTRSWWLLRPFRRRPDIATFRSIATRWQLWLTLRRRSPLPPGEGIVIHERFCDQATVTALLRVAPRVVCWAVDSIERAAALEAVGVDGLIIDDLELIEALRRRR